MKAFSSHATALAYWRQHFPLDSELGRPARMSKAEDYAFRKEDVLECVTETFAIPGKPIDILVFSAEERRLSKQVACHVWGVAIPPRAFYRVGQMYVSSPEFVFLQMAPQLSVAQLVALGCELCGTYVLLPQGATHASSLDEHPTRLAPLTNIDKLSAFVERAKGARGRAKAIRALRYVIEGSRSPMETMVYLLLCLPPKLGGYGFPKPVMNESIELDDEGRAIANRRFCEGDLCWRDGMLDIEYHGDVHVGAANMKSDVGRELGIEHMKWRVITVTSPQVFDIDQFETVAKEAAVRIGKRLFGRVLGRIPARQALHEELSSWMLAADCAQSAEAAEA